MRKARQPVQAPIRVRFFSVVFGSLERFLEISLIAAMLLISVVVHYWTPSSITAKDYYAAWFGLFFLLSGGFLFFRQKEWRNRSAWIFIPLLLYVLYAVIRVFFSPYPVRSWESLRLTLGSMAPLIPAYLLAQNPRSLRKLLFAFTFIVWLVCLYGVLQFISQNIPDSMAWGRRIDPITWSWNKAPLIGDILKFLETDMSYFQWEKFPGMLGLNRSYSTFGNPTYFAGFLVLLVPIILGIGFSRIHSGKSSWKAFLHLIPVMMGLAVTLSKGAILGAFGGVAQFLMFLGISPSSRIHPTVRKICRVVSPLMLIATWILLGGIFLLAGESTDEAASQSKLQSVEVRSMTYSTTAAMIRDHLLFGVGPGNFAVFFPDYMKWSETESYGWSESPEDKVMEHAHNEFIEVLVDLGFVGFMLLITFWGAFVLLAWKAWQDGSSLPESWWLAGFLSAVFAGLCENMTSVSLRWTPSAWNFWLAAGFAAGLAGYLYKKQPGQTETPAVQGRYVKTALFSALALTTLLFIPASSRFMSDWYYVGGRQGQKQGRPETESLLVRSIELDPYAVASHYLLGGLLYENGRYGDAIEHFEKVRQLRGDVVVVTENLATSYFKISSESSNESDRQMAMLQAVDYYEESLKRHPTYARLQDYLSRCYQRIGFDRRARDYRLKSIELYEKWFAWGKSYPRPNYALDLGKNYIAEKEYEKSFWILRNVITWKGDPARLKGALDSLFKAIPELQPRWDHEIQLLQEKAASELMK